MSLTFLVGVFHLIVVSLVEMTLVSVIEPTSTSSTSSSLFLGDLWISGVPSSPSVVLIASLLLFVSFLFFVLIVLLAIIVFLSSLHDFDRLLFLFALDNLPEVFAVIDDLGIFNRSINHLSMTLLVLSQLFLILEFRSLVEVDSSYLSGIFLRNWFVFSWLLLFLPSLLFSLLLVLHFLLFLIELISFDVSVLLKHLFVPSEKDLEVFWAVEVEHFLLLFLVEISSLSIFQIVEV